MNNITILNNNNTFFNQEVLKKLNSSEKIRGYVSTLMGKEIDFSTAIKFIWGWQ